MPHTRIVNRLPSVLAECGVSWAELSRRTLLPGRLLARLRDPGANPRLAVAERVAGALDVPVEAVWLLRRSR
jgi:hypothetical protein